MQIKEFNGFIIYLILWKLQPKQKKNLLNKFYLERFFQLKSEFWKTQKKY